MTGGMKASVGAAALLACMVSGIVATYGALWAGEAPALKAPPNGQMAPSQLPFQGEAEQVGAGASMPQRMQQGGQQEAAKRPETRLETRKSRKKKHATALRLAFRDLYHLYLHEGKEAHPQKLPAGFWHQLAFLKTAFPARAQGLPRTWQEWVAGKNDVLGVRDLLLEIFEVSLTPAREPDLSRGKSLFQRHCQSCHGMAGKGDGVLAKRLEPPPRSFAQPPLRGRLTAHQIYNLLLIGLSSGSMVSLEEMLSGADLWSLTYYALSLTADCGSDQASRKSQGKSRLPYKELALWNADAALAGHPPQGSRTQIFTRLRCGGAR